MRRPNGPSHDLGRRHGMILPDVNVLVHAHNTESAVHFRARQWWEECLAGSEGVGLAWAALLGFIHLTTNRKIVAAPLRVNEVMRRIESWLDLPHVHLVQPSDSHFVRLRTEFERLGTAGNLTTDAHLAVLAMERGYVLYSTDADFARFPGLRWTNPCVA
jgi:toxin-antitoxin system PIN domain toxin